MKALTSVYSYYLPETRKVIDEIIKDFPHELYLENTKLDDFHIPIIERYKKWTKNQIKGLDDFEYVYPTNGSSEGIFHLLADIKANQPSSYGGINYHKGEYEGYKHYADSLNIRNSNFNITNDFNDWMFLSNPSAKDGNILTKQWYLDDLMETHKVAYDLAYVGMAAPHIFDVSNAKTVFVSFSKPFGMFYYRTGLLFSKFEIPSLNANKWFKNIFGLMIADKMMQKYPIDYFWKKYRPIQEKIITRIKKEDKINIKASDVYLLGWCEENAMEYYKQKNYQKYKREDNYRFCLTPYFKEELDG